MTRLRIAVVEPYLSGSHRAWAYGYKNYSRHDVAVISHEGRAWKWRMQGSYITLARSFRNTISASGPFDVVLASSMLHLPAFLGAARSDLEGVPVALYFHESQFTYPVSPRSQPDEAYPLINWGSAAVADLVLFNSEFHMSTFFSAARRLLQRFPDHRHTDFLDEVRHRSLVRGVGVELKRFGEIRSAYRDPPVILWNQRWEFDKGPAQFAAAIRELASGCHDFRVVMTGERFVGQPEEFEALPGLLGNRLLHFGFAEDDDYVSLVRSADIVVSTALQEFFGVAITEAVYAGAFPVLPNRLVYPERIPTKFHEHCLYSDGELLEGLEWALTHPDERKAIATALRSEMDQYDWGVMAPHYDESLEGLVA